MALIATNTAALLPELSIRRTLTNTVVVFWPESDIVWLLQSTTNPGDTPVSWMDIPPPYATNGAHVEFLEPAPTGNQFYRLENR